MITTKQQWCKFLRKCLYNKRFLGKQKVEQSQFNQGALACFGDLCQALSCNNRIIEVNLSGCNINVYYAIELANLVQKNTNIEVLQLASCKLNSFSLSCIFKAMIDHTGLAQLNLFNNQSFTPTVVQDFIKYVLKGKNPLVEINISHCNIENAQLSMLLTNVKHLKSLKRLKMALMNLDSESILALCSASLHYTGKRYLDYIDLSFCCIKNHGIELFNRSLSLSVVTFINIKSINLSGNHISQDGVQFLEQVLLKLNVEELNLSRNKISEFQNSQVLSKMLVRIDLSSNMFEEIPNNFFLNVLSINLANNQISTQGAYQISQVLSYKKVQWVDLNINNNSIKTRGFISLIYALIENRTLTNLSVANNKINGEGILVYIFNHEQLNLQYLDLSSNYLRYDLVYALISMMKECQLKTLILSQLIQDENEIQSGKNELFEIKCTNLRMLDFSSNPQIIMPILKSISKQYNRLEYLNLNDCQLFRYCKAEASLKKGDTFEIRRSGEATKFFFEDQIDYNEIKIQHHKYSNNSLVLECLSYLILKTQTLQTLCLANNNLYLLSESELKQLSSCLSKNYTLTSLDISNNRLRSRIIYLVDGLKNCCSLRYLNISNNQIEEDYDVAIKLPEVLRNPSLQFLDISLNSIHRATFQNMKKVLQKSYKQFPQMNLSQLQLTADDLVSVSDIIRDSYSIRKLELFGNQSIDYLNNVILYGENDKVESLSINRLRLRNDIYENLITVVNLNLKCLHIVEISNTLLKNDQLKGLLDQLKQIHSLKALILDHQYFDNESVIKSLKELFETLNKLKTLSINKSVLSHEFFEFIYSLLCKSHKLQELDLSNNKSNDYKNNCLIQKQCFDLLCQGLQYNKSLIKLNLSKLQLNDELFGLLIDVLPYNNKLSHLNISQNIITKQSYLRFMKQFQEYPCDLEVLCCQQISAELPLNLIKSKSLARLLDLDISNNSQRCFSLQKLVLCCQVDNLFQNLYFINLELCNLCDKHCSIISKLIKTNLQELHLSQNQITSKGFSVLFKPILDGHSQLKALNLSKNQIDDHYFIDLEQKDLNIGKLQLLSLDGNHFFGKGKDGFIRLLRNNRQLYIFNDWNNINDELAYLIIESYIHFTSQYAIKDGIRNYIQQLVITDSDFSDEFLIWFGYNFFQLPYLRFINFSGATKLCTSKGKMYMYINMVNSQVNYNLQEVKFEEMTYQTLTIFDDGLMRFHLLRQKFKFQNFTKMQSSYGISDQNVETIKWGLVGKFIIHIINKLLYLFQGPLIEFRVSSKLQQHLRRKMNRVKMYYFMGSIIDPLQFIFSMTTAFMSRNPLNSEDLQSNSNCRSQYCFVNDSSNLTFILLISNLLFVFGCCITSLHIAIKLRNHSEPEYCIITTEQRKLLTLKYPLKNELFLLFLQTLFNSKYIFDMQMIGASLEYNRFIRDNNYDLEQCRKNFIALSYMVTIMMCVKLSIFCYQDAKCTIQFFKHPNKDSSFLLSNMWIKQIYQANILVENAIVNFCPQQEIKVSKTNYNLKQVYEITQLLFIELPILFLYLFFFINYLNMYNQIGYNTVFTVTGIIIFIGMIRNVIKLLYNFYWTLVSRPPIVKWFDINEVLLLRQCQHLGVRRLSPFQPYKTKKSQKDLSYQKKKQHTHQNNNLFTIQKTKSDRLIQKSSLKTQRKHSQEQDEEGDFLVKKQIQTTQNLYLCVQKIKSD